MHFLIVLALYLMTYFQRNAAPLLGGGTTVNILVTTKQIAGIYLVHHIKQLFNHAVG